jgi:hypothetical protein
MMEFHSFQELKTFMSDTWDFLANLHLISPVIDSYPGPIPLDDIEKNIITTIYNSYKEKGTTIRQIAGNFQHLLLLLIPSRNFADIFKHLIYLEWMEHRIKPDLSKKKSKLYRDHILHCANVCWIGHRLISHLEEPFEKPLKKCLQNILPPTCKEMLKDESQWREFIKTTWYITALVHDFGYPIELVERKYTGDELYLCSKNYLHADKLNHYFDAKLSGSIPVFRKQLEKIDKKLLKNPFRHCDSVHPIIGCIELLHFLKGNYRKLRGSQVLYRYIYQLAALGIFEHHKEGEIDFDLNPFGYLLALADTLHEWHRYVCIGTSGAGSTKPKFISPITKLTIKRKEANLYGIRFSINPRWKKCTEWDRSIFMNSKKKELKRLKRKTGLPQFFIE